MLNSAKAENISVGLFLSDISEIKDVDETLTIDFYLRIFWEDHNILKKFKGNGEILSNNEIIPTFLILNEKDLKRSLGDVIRLEPDGRISIMYRYSGKISSKANYNNFPFDSQTFSIQVVFPKPNYLLTLAGGLTSELNQFSVPGWDFNKKRFFITKYEGSKIQPFNFPMLELSIEGKRKIGYYLWKIYLPIILIVLISWAAFFLDLSLMEARTNIAITANLTLIAYLFVLAEMIPHISYLSRIDYFIIGSLVLVFISFWGVIITFLTNKKSPHLGNLLQVSFRYLHPLCLVLFLLSQMKFE